MAFKAIRYDSGKVVELKATSGATGVKWDTLAEDAAGRYQRATSATTLVRYVLLDAVTSATEGDPLRCLPTDGVQFEADTNADPVQTDVGTTADLTDHDTLNESASSNDVFFIEEIVGATTDKKVRGYFVTDKAS